MIKNKKRSRSFFTLLVRSYMLFTLTIAIAISSILLISMYRVNNVLKEPKAKDVVDYASLLSREQYDEIPVEYLMGKGAYIQILDENNKSIYESNPSKAKGDFTEGQLECIEDYSSVVEVYVEDYYNSNKEKNISVSIYYDNSDEATKIYLIDKDLNLIYTNTVTNRKSFTKREFEYLTGKYPSGYNIRKHTFNSKDNKKYTLITYTPSLGLDTYAKIERVNIEGIVLFIIIYVILTLLFILWMNRKVRRPINLLNQAIVGFKNGTRKNYLHYGGPREFEDICESFNDMSKKLYESEQKREQLEQDKQKMLADISHDLKTPITVIKGYSKAVCDNLILEEEKEQYLMTIYQKADNLDELINTFYEYSKMEHPEYKLILERLDICEYSRAYLAQKYDELYISGVDVQADIPEDNICCNIDKVQLKRVFENIVSNSLKHNKGNLSILFEVKKIKDKVRIIIADNGVGIPDEVAENIFEPFVVGEKSRTKQGSGLGLAIGKKIIEAHGGSIRLIASSKHYKTKFEILLPINKT